MVQQKRQCYGGDTIITVKPMNGPGGHLAVVVETPAACAQANDLILSGRWHVTKCVLCLGNPSIGECSCEGKQ